MSLQKPIALALFLLALSGCTTQAPQVCQPLHLPELLMRDPQALRSLPSPKPSSEITQPATATPSN